MHEIERRNQKPFMNQTTKKISYPIDEGDRLFVYDVDSFLETNHTNYDYVKRYDPTYGDKKDWHDIVPQQYHQYEDHLWRKRF